jgi:hypothetical protein
MRSIDMALKGRKGISRCRSARQPLRKMRSISSAATPVTCATCRTVMPCFTHARIRATCDAGIVGAAVSGSGQIAGSDFSRRADSGGVTLKTRGLCADGSASGGLSAADGLATGYLGAKSASAAARTLVDRWRSLRSAACRCSNRSGKDFLLQVRVLPITATGFTI